MQSELTNYPALELHEEEIFITVKTYPRPSPKYRELVCTVGITKSGKWIRLYPISFRYMDYQNWYKKYQWIKVKIEKNIKDFRLDTYRPIESTIQTISEQYGTEKGWLKRKQIIMPTVEFNSLEEIEDNYQANRISLGIFKPKEIIDFIVESDNEEWGKNQKQVLSQMRLFEKQPKVLEKIPFKFSYKFICNDKRCNKPHKLSIIDWEIFALYLNIRNKYQYEMDVILEKIKEKWLNQMWNNKKDSYIIVGTRYPSPTFMVLGVFWPPK